MFEPKNLSWLPPAIVDHQLLVGIGTIFCWLLLGYYNGQSRKLTHIPSTESDLPLFSYIGTLNYLLDARKVVIAGAKKWPSAMFKVPDMLQWLVVVTEPRLIEEIRKAPDSVFSFSDGVDELTQIYYTLGEQISKNPYHIPILRRQLTGALPQLVPDLHEEVVDAINEFIPLTGDWTGVKALETFMNVICRASNRAFVGRPLCRNPEFIALNIQFTIDVVQAGTLIRLTPRFLRPLVNKLVSNVSKGRRQGLRLLAPILAARRKEREEKGDNDDKPVDLLTWLFDEAKGKETTDFYLTSRIMALNFASIHTSSMAFTHGLYYLAALPEYMPPLREEVEEIIAREGWTKAGVDQMYKLDSFIKESQRLHPHDIFIMRRVARRDHTLSDGTTIPRGTTLVVSAHPIHMDEKIYPDALKFDPFRFVKLKEQDTSGRKFDIATTSVDSLPFGHGKHACPGRYFAACDLKLILAHLVMNYDMKLENDGVRPQDMWVATNCVPNPNARVFFRRRAV